MAELRNGPYRVGVIGDPVAHSLSPAFHQPALDRAGVAATYERWHTTAADLPARVASLRAADVLGANVTVPHKVAVMSLVDEVSSAAQRAGAVNTIVNREGRLYGDNTDIYGCQVALAEVMAGDVPDSAVILGAGGASRAAVLALEALGVARILVLNRDLERAKALAADLAPAPVSGAAFDEQSLRASLPQAGLLLNATAVGWRPGESPLDVEWLAALPERAVVFDMTYRQTELLKAANARGLRHADGLGMLVHQGARAFTLFTGHPAPVEVMLAAAHAAQAATR